MASVLWSIGDDPLLFLRFAAFLAQTCILCLRSFFGSREREFQRCTPPRRIRRIIPADFGSRMQHRGILQFARLYLLLGAHPFFELGRSMGLPKSNALGLSIWAHQGS